MKRPNRILTSVIATGVLGITSQSVLAQTTLFNDTFNNGSTGQQPPTPPTANSTSYETFQQGGTPNAPVITAGNMHLAGRTTASSLYEVQALFTTTPVILQNIGDTLTFNISFVNNQNIFPSGSASTINVGLYNSGGVAPNTGVNFTTGNTTGGSQGWNGYVGRISGGTGSSASSLFTRFPQTANGTTSQNQDLLFNGASGTGSYNSPGGANIALSSGGGVFGGFASSGSSYSLSYSITLTGANTLSFSDTLFDSGNNSLFTESGSLTSATNNYTYDAFAFGWRYNSTSATNAIDVSSISVIQSVTAVPEPTTTALTLTGLGLLFLVRRNRS
jgi:hypothetical protein